MHQKIICVIVFSVALIIFKFAFLFMDTFLVSDWTYSWIAPAGFVV